MKKRVPTKATQSKLDELLEDITVLGPGDWVGASLDDGSVKDDWFAVADETGIVAYFGKEVDACRFRLDLVNRRLNP